MRGMKSCFLLHGMGNGEKNGLLKRLVHDSGITENIFAGRQYSTGEFRKIGEMQPLPGVELCGAPHKEPATDPFIVAVQNLMQLRKYCTVPSHCSAAFFSVLTRYRYNPELSFRHSYMATARMYGDEVVNRSLTSSEYAQHRTEVVEVLSDAALLAFMQVRKAIAKIRANAHANRGCGEGPAPRICMCNDPDISVLLEDARAAWGIEEAELDIRESARALGYAHRKDAALLSCLPSLRQVLEDSVFLPLLSGEKERVCAEALGCRKPVVAANQLQLFAA